MILYIAIFIISLILIVTKIKKNEIVRIPGPPQCSTELGNIPDIVKAGSLHHFLRYCHEKYGPLVNFRLGQNNCISTYTPEDYRSQLKLFNKPEMTMGFLTPIFGNRCIQFVNGDEAKLRRQTYDSYLNSEAVTNYFPCLKKIVGDVVPGIETIPDNTGIPLYQYMFKLSCKAVGVTMFGDYFDNDENVEEFRVLYEKFWPLLEKNVTQGLPPEGSEERTEFDKVSERVKDIVEQMIQSRKNARDRKFIDVVLETCSDPISGNGDILTYLVGGFHSTSIALTWSIYHICKYPEMRSRIQTEVDSIFTSCYTVEESDLGRFKYLRQFIDETLRLRFVAPITTRASTENFCMRGYEIPIGTHIYQALSVNQTNPDLWEEPDRFDPDRFNTERSKLRPRLAFCPFGFAGRRMCPGRNFFYAEAVIYLATLFRHFEFNLQTEEEIEITYGLLTRPSREIIVTKRNRLY